MIIVRLIGGLGNQLFQYALGRHLTEIHKTMLKLDISGFETYTLHKYSLSSFNIQENLASPEEILAFKFKRQGIEYLLRKLFSKPPKPAPMYIRERHFHFDSEALNLPDNIYLEGCWQSEKYFVDIRDIIHEEFTIKVPQDGRNKKLAEQITSCESVSLHIRRRDYASDLNTSQVHGICNMNYYILCVEQLTLTVKNPHFFIFSDDPEWARDNLKLFYPMTFVEHNGAVRNYEDLRLISQCKHNIIANSTFSWWGAWLNPNPGKIVVAPDKWFKSDDYNTTDLIPDRWIKV